MEKENLLIMRHFIAFLKGNNALDKYLFNIKLPNNPYSEYFIHKRLFSKNALNKSYFLDDAELLILAAFRWRDTIEGSYYWEALSDDWRRLQIRLRKRLALFNSIQ